MHAHSRVSGVRLGLIAAALAGGFSLPVAAAPGDPLGPAFSVSTQGGGLPTVARDPDGDIIVAWLQPGIGILVRLLHADGTPKGLAQVVEPQMPGSSLVYPDVAVDGDGDFVVAWTTKDATPAAPAKDPVVYARRYAADGAALGTRLQVNEPLDGQPGKREYTFGRPAVAMDRDGNFVVAWEQGRKLETHIGDRDSCYQYGVGLCMSLSGYTIRMRRYTDGGTAAQGIQTVTATGNAEVTLTPLHALLGSTYGSYESYGSVAVAMAPDGRFVVAWDRVGGTLSLLPGVYARRYDAGGAGENQRLVAWRSDLPCPPTVAMRPDGAYVVAYCRLDDARLSALYTRGYPADPRSPAGRETRVNEPGGPVRAPALAMDAAGNYVLAWALAQPYDYRIRGQRYADGGAALGTNFEIGQFSAGCCERTFTDVASDGGGNFVVAWDSSPGGVLARLYDGP
jgi:hypothetical protein